MPVVTPHPVESPLFNHSQEMSNLLFLVQSVLSTIFIQYPLTWVARGLSACWCFEKVLFRFRTKKCPKCSTHMEAAELWRQRSVSRIVFQITRPHSEMNL